MKFIRPFRKRELTLIWICLIIIAGIVTDKVIQRINLKFIRTEAEIAFNQEKLLRLNMMLAQAKELNSEYERFLSGYKELNDSDALLQEITGIARKMNTNILNIKPGATNHEGSYKRYSIKIEIQGEIPSLAKFLYVLTEELKGINIEQLQINTQGKDGLPKASISISAAAFNI